MSCPRLLRHVNRKSCLSHNIAAIQPTSIIIIHPFTQPCTHPFILTVILPFPPHARLCASLPHASGIPSAAFKKKLTPERQIPNIESFSFHSSTWPALPNSFLLYLSRQSLILPLPSINPLTPKCYLYII